jgi:hypothetical protein
VSRARRIQYNKEWQDRALAFARTLKGRPHTEDEQEFIEETDYDPWDYFRVFGIQPETQAYVDKTIQMLEELDPNDLADAVVIEIRLKWSAEEIR